MDWQLDERPIAQPARGLHSRVDVLWAHYALPVAVVVAKIHGGHPSPAIAAPLVTQLGRHNFSATGGPDFEACNAGTHRAGRRGL